jgi:glycerol-3-phosphate dehydrogenase
MSRAEREGSASWGWASHHVWQADNVHRFRRQDSLRRLADEHFDVLVVGGGVTGAGVALDAASRGLKTALVEKSDFASGTSSKSSKMIHGGLRYLQQREFRLVYENLAERQRLLNNAPHLVSPLPFLIPLFGRDGVVSKTVARSYSVALWLYDITGGLRIGARHKRVTKEQALAHLPTLNTEHLVAGFLYFDARADDARLTLTLARTAAVAHGAVVANYTSVTSLTTDDDGNTNGAIVRSDPSDASTEFAVRARVVVNATGVWADEVRALDEGSHPRSIRPAKGVHVSLPAHRLPSDIAAVIPVPQDRRSIFVVPWPETDLVYVGTTDTDYQGPLEDPSCTPEDVDYLLEAANNVTTSQLTRADVTGVWAGLRPLLAPPDKGGHVSERTSDLSRRHTVRTSGHGVVTVTGGKLTTYRKMAEDTVDAVVVQLGESPKTRRCVTKSLRLLGATTATKDPVAMARPLAHLLSRYGTESAVVLALAEDRPELLEPVIAGLPYTGAELVYAAREEMAQTLDDVLARRTRAMIQRAQPTMAAAHAAAMLIAPELGWDEQEAAEQASRFIESCQKELLTAGLDLL